MANDTFSRLVEGGPDDGRQKRPGPESDKLEFWDSFAAAGEERMKVKQEPERKDFWDDFAAAGEERASLMKQQEPEKKDFWDDFAAIGEAKRSPAKAKKASVGTAAMRRPGGAGKGDEWGEW